MPLHVLLVDPEAERLAPSLRALDGLDVSPVTSAMAARAYLAGSAFDAVVASADLPGLDGVAEVARTLGVSRGVLTFAADERDTLAERLGPRLGVARRAGGAVLPQAAAPDAEALRETLRGLQAELGRVAHDLANPLAVVVGNAQLGAEIARALGADESLGQAFADIEEAGHALSDRIGQIAALRTRLETLL